jgi:hypothetical protein
MTEREELFQLLQKIMTENREELFDFLHKKMFEVQAKKGRDYGEEQDGLGNLRRRGIAGILNRMEDKIYRIRNLTSSDRRPLVEDEPIEDTCIDTANYALLIVILYWDLTGHNPLKGG